MLKYALPLLIGLLAGTLSAQKAIEPSPVKSNQKPWTSLEANNDNFQFVVVTDRTGGLRPGVFASGVHKINLLQPEFVMSVGDLITGYTEDSVVLDQQWGEFDSIAALFEMPFFYVAGNHDYTNPYMAKLWAKKFGVEYYYFKYNDVLFLCLNSEDGATRLINPDLGEEQLEWAQEVLKQHPDVRWTMVFMHQPLWIHPESKNWQTLEKSLDGRKHSVFTGHVHRYTLYQRNKSDYFTLATMGGASSLKGPSYGEFDHFMWITMTEDGPYYANVMLDGVFGKDVFTEKQLQIAESYNLDPPIKLEPWFATDKTPDHFTFTVHNPDTVTRSLLFSPRGGSFFQVEREPIRQDIGPGETTKIKIPVEATGTPTQEGSPFRTWVEFIGPDFVWTRYYRAFPNERLPIPQTSKRHKVDGKLSEWKNWEYQFGEAENKADAQVNFSIRQDADMLYVAATVQDDEIQGGFGKEYDETDGLILMVDPRPLQASAYNNQDEEALMRGEWMALIAQPGPEKVELAYPMLVPEGATAKGRRTKDGYTVEYAIPLSLLDKAQGGKWETIRLNVALMDADGDARKAQSYTWMPEWKRHNVASGTFFRE